MTVNHGTAKKVYGWLESLHWKAFPARCALCGASGLTRLEICRGCRDDLPWQRRACERCGERLPGADGAAAPVCGRCRRRPPPFDRTRAAFGYEAPVSHLLRELKFRGRLANGRLLGELMAEALAAHPEPRPDLLVPVPLHPARQRRRGFNQAVELARPLAVRLGIPLGASLCRRVRNTAPQSELGARQRHGNVRRAFAVTAHAPSHVAIVDDVMTSASTVGALATVLRRSGARRIEIWVCARASG